MRGDAQLPTSVIAFLRSHVDHLVKLELLLVLHGAPSGTTSVPIVARELDVPKRQVRDMANELVEEDLVRVSSDRIELAPRSIDDRLAIADLATWYVRDREVIVDVLKALGRFAN